MKHCKRRLHAFDDDQDVPDDCPFCAYAIAAGEIVEVPRTPEELAAFFDEVIEHVDLLPRGRPLSPIRACTHPVVRDALALGESTASTSVIDGAVFAVTPIRYCQLCKRVVRVTT